MAEETYIHKSGRAYGRLVAIAEEADSLALSFHNLGNKAMADKLFNIAYVIEHQSKAMNEAMGEAFKGHMTCIQQASTMQVKAVLAGIKTREESEVESNEE